MLVELWSHTGEFVFFLRWAETITIDLLFSLWRRVYLKIIVWLWGEGNSWHCSFAWTTRKIFRSCIFLICFFCADFFRWKTISKKPEHSGFCKGYPENLLNCKPLDPPTSTGLYMTATFFLLLDRIAPMSIADPDALKYFGFKLLWICCYSASAFFRSFSFFGSRVCRRNSCSCC